MRIISGSFKGKKIIEPKDKKTRPLKDLTKESIFNIINHSHKFKVSMNNALILDVFSGTGSFGIECLSRGAQEVIFIENYGGVTSVLKKNLINLKTVHNYEIIEDDALNVNTFARLNKQFDIIFLDPPYKFENLKSIFENIENTRILKDEGIIISHRHKKTKDIFPTTMRVIEQKNYGISKIIFTTFLK